MTKQPLPKNVRVLGWASLVNDISSEAAYAILPAFLTSIGISKPTLGLLEGLANTTSSLLKIFFGAWSDRLGHRKAFIVVGYTMSALAKPLLGLAQSTGWVFLMRLADRFGKGLRTAPRDALLTESTPDEMRGSAYGFHRSMDHLGAMVGPLLAFAFLWYFPGQLRDLILLTAIPGVIGILIPVLGLSSAKPSNDDQKVGKQAAVLEKEKFFGEFPKGSFRQFLLVLVVFTLANSSDAFLLLRAAELGVSTTYLPILWAMHAGLNSIFSRFGGRAADKFSPRKLILAGWVVYAAVYMGMGFANAAWQVWILFAGYSVFYALTESPEKKLVARFAKTGEAGRAFGWFHTIVGLANLPASLIFGWLYHSYSGAVAFTFGASLALIAAIILSQIRLSPKVLAHNEIEKTSGNQNSGKA